jgi:predicted secreted hydrolase
MKRVCSWYDSVVMIVALAAFGLLIMAGVVTSKLYAADDYNKQPMCEPMVTLPGDDSAHPYVPPDNLNTLEWWYWTGHLRTEGNRWFGFETTFFSYPMYGMQSVDQAVTDIADGTFHFTSIGPVAGAPDYVPNGFDLAINQAYAQGGDGHDVLHGEVDGYVFDLELDSKKDPVLQYCTGFIDYLPFFGVAADSFYYSREHMKVKGNILVPGEGWLKVTGGTAWFDHQWGNQIGLFELDIDWNWFAIQLNDQREIMVYLLRKDGQMVLSHGSLSNANGDTIELEGDDFTITTTDWWTNDSGCVYDMEWEIEVAGMTLHVDPVFENQEVVDGGYWEGVAIVTGTRGTGEGPVSVRGRAFVEMAGYCTTN